MRSNMRLGQTRSIPACTGEPAVRCYGNPLNGVYPRVYGGTTSRSMSSKAR